ncbi:MAG: hypothetical protein PHP54_04365 [Clostridia bacterium]|nr:hypothetical protein [Clostridia bacterium]
MENQNNDSNGQVQNKKIRKIGRLTFGITLILVGLSVFLQTLLTLDIYRYILMLWPLVFVSIGIEVIYFSRREDTNVKYDGLGIFLIFVVLFFGTIFGAINYGVNKVFYSDNVKNQIVRELSDDVVTYEFDKELVINNYADKAIDVEIVEQSDEESTRIIAKAIYKEQYDINLISYFRGDYRIHDMLSISRYHQDDDNVVGENRIDIINIPSNVENLKIKVITSNKDNVKLIGDINLK